MILSPGWTFHCRLVDLAAKNGGTVEDWRTLVNRVPGGLAMIDDSTARLIGRALARWPEITFSRFADICVRLDLTPRMAAGSLLMP